MNKEVGFWSCDFETTTDINDCRVWSWGCAEIHKHSNFIWGEDIDSFMKWCAKENKILYYQNLRFDGEFIVHYLLSNGFIFRNTALSNDEEYLKKGKVKLKDKEFTAIISDDGKYYYIEICFFTSNKKKRYVKIYDGLKKIPFSVRKMAKAFKLDIRKGEIDYKKERPIGYIPTEIEIEYQKNDVQIPAQALSIQLNKGLDKMTIGSDSMAFYKNIMGNKFRSYFPALDKEEHTFIRKSYKGGFCWVNPKYQGKTVGNGFSYDDNSLYPSRMYFCEMPTGLGIYGIGKYEKDNIYNLYVQRIRCCFKLKKNKIPMIQIKGSSRFRETEYLNECQEVQELTLTCVDLKLFFEQYDVFELEYVSYYKYRGVKRLFNAYIDYWNEIKMNNIGGLRELAKLMLNNLYGKFSTSDEVGGKYPYLGENGEVKYSLLETVTRETVYLPVGTFITSYGRDLCIRTAQACYNNKDIAEIDYTKEYDIAYCDTDSIHCVGTGIPKIEIHDKKLGAWKHESDFVKARFLRQKTYLERIVVDKNKIEDEEKEEMTIYQRDLLEKASNMDIIKCAGMGEKIRHSLYEVNPFDYFYIGFEARGNLKPKHVKGGIVLEEKPFKIR